MKKYKSIVVLVAMMFIQTLVCSQTLTDVARSSELTWYGIDFSVAKFVGFKSDDLDDKIPDDWGYTYTDNNVTNRPSEIQPGFDYSIDPIASIKHMYGKKSILIDTKATKENNDTIKVKNRLTNGSYSITIDKIKKVVEEHKIKGSGFGVLLVVESVEKISNSIFIWVVYINNETGQIISSRRYSGCKWGRDGRRGKFYSLKGIKLIIEASGNDLKTYKK